jgi:bla regulator protein BlaR1
MPPLFVFLLKVNIALIVFCLGYYLVLRQLTFYTLNRIYLFIAIIFSSVYPLINVNNFVQRHNIPVQNVMVSWKIPAEKFAAPIVQQPFYWHWAAVIFWIGAGLFAMRLLIQLTSLYKLYKKSSPGKIQEHNVRIVNANISPFSFWQSIYINPENLNPGDLKSILKHEQVHVKQWHTLDILLTEISVIFYWFNPGVWLMKRAVRENIEFITDRKILQEGTDSKAYQYSLLNVSFSATTSAGITNHFNFSTLKKRITMMNAKKSSDVNLTRYAFLVPTVLVCLFAISLSKAELVKKSKVAYKTITASVNNLNRVITINDIAIEKKPVHRVKVLDTVKKTKTVNATLMAIQPDTNRTYKVAMTQENNTLDSVTFIIDGKVAKNGDFKLINPDDIERLEVVKGTPTKGIIVVQTKNKAVRVVQGYRMNGVNSTDDKLNAVVVTGYATPKTTTNNITVTTNRPTVTSVRLTTSGDNTSINNLSDKLFFIDDKEATEKDMRKLPAADIQSMEVRKGKEMTDKYGDKAKNGVIFIKTKKGK